MINHEVEEKEEAIPEIRRDFGGCGRHVEQSSEVCVGEWELEGGTYGRRGMLGISARRGEEGGVRGSWGRWESMKAS